MKIIDFFNEKQIDLENKKLLVAASGGPDSMALLDMLKDLQKKQKFELIAAHFNHQLRSDSEEETRILKDYCQKNEIPLFVAKWAKNEQPKSGIEAAAREVRYNFLTKIAKNETADYLLTAHHGDDLIENILLKFIRSGNPEEMNSLQAVGVMHGVTLLRPLLSSSKQEILEYDKERGISFIVDSTNKEDDTMRNRMRHHVVPILKKENPALIQNALRFSYEMSDLTNAVDEKINETGTIEKFLGQAYRIKSSEIKRLTEDQQIVFWQKIIWQKFHRRVNKNLGNFSVIEYQGFVYLYKNNLEISKKIFTIKINEPFIFNNRKLLLTTKENMSKKKLGDFWFNCKTEFNAGVLITGSKFLLQDGTRVKAKKKFAEHAIPFALRPLCLAIYADREPIFVENTYQNQNWIKNGKHYFLYAN